MMPVVFDCPSCMRRLKAADGSHGRTVQCSGCGMRLEVPAPIADGLLTLPERRVADAPGFSVDVDVDTEDAPLEVVRTSIRAASNREPWFYGFLSAYGWLCVLVGAAQFALVASAWSGSQARLDALVGSGLILLGSLLGAAWSFILVDIGRTVRRR